MLEEAYSIAQDLYLNDCWVRLILQNLGNILALKVIIKFRVGNSSKAAISFSLIKFYLRITVLGLGLMLGLGLRLVLGLGLGLNLVCSHNQQIVSFVGNP